MSIIAYTDFTGERNIPNRSDAVTQESITAFIQKYEPKYLVELLGIDLYTQFVTGLASNPIDQKWSVLRDMVKQAIVDYVYNYYLEDAAIQNTGTGTVTANNENSSLISPGRKMVKAWNELVDITFQAVKFINSQETAYGIYYDSRIYAAARGYQVCCLPDIFYKKNTLGI